MTSIRFSVFLFVVLMAPLISFAQDDDLPFAAKLNDVIKQQEDQMLLEVKDEWRALAAIPNCEPCALLHDDVMKLLDAHDVFRRDLARGLMRLTGGMDTGEVLVGRMDGAALFLPLKDFMFTLHEISGREGAFEEAVEPGVYSRSELNSVSFLLDRHAAFQLRDVLAEMEKQVEDALPKPVIIAPVALNVLYTGVENPVKVIAGSASPETVQLSGSEVRKGEEPGIWYIKPTNPGPVTIQVEGTTPSGGKVNGSAEFTARRVPMPKVYVAGRTDGIIIKKDMAAQSGISARNDNFLFEADYEVKGFEMVYTPEYGSPVSKKTPGNKFTPEQLDLLQRTKPGDRLLFRVSVGMPDGSIQKVSPIYYVR